MLLFFFFYTNMVFRDMYTCSVNMLTVSMNVCMYLHMCGSIKQRISIHFIFSFTPSLSLPLPFLLRLLNLFILLMTFQNNYTFL